jgi:hypothetical protein
MESFKRRGSDRIESVRLGDNYLYEFMHIMEYRYRVCRQV